MLDDTLQQLDALCDGPTQTAPLCIHVCEFDDDRAPEGAFENVQDKYLQLVEINTKRWGQPDFAGNWESRGFPDWHHWVANLTFWKRGDRYVYIEFDQPDNELPFTISIGTQEIAE